MKIHPVIVGGIRYRTIKLAAIALAGNDNTRIDTIVASLRKVLSKGRTRYLGLCVRYADDVDAEKPIKTRPNGRAVDAPLMRRLVTTRLGHSEGGY